jgi:hypothetical protein
VRSSGGNNRFMRDPPLSRSVRRTLSSSGVQGLSPISTVDGRAVDVPNIAIFFGSLVFTTSLPHPHRIVHRSRVQAAPSASEAGSAVSIAGFHLASGRRRFRRNK